MGGGGGLVDILVSLRCSLHCTVPSHLATAGNGEGFTTPSLTVSEYCAVESIQSIENRLTSDLVKNLLLTSGHVQDSIELEAVVGTGVVHYKITALERNVELELPSISLRRVWERRQM